MTLRVTLPSSSPCRDKWGEMWLPVFLASLLLGVVGAEPQVKKRDHYWLSWAGGQSVTISGSGFSVSQFNHFDDTLGNKVYFVNEDDTIECDVTIGHTSTEQIVCTTRPRTSTGPNTYYAIKVYSDGVLATGYLDVRYGYYHGPMLQYVRPIWSLPNEIVTLTGWFRADNYINVDFEDPTLVDTNAGTVIRSVYMNMMDCDMLNYTTNELFAEVTDNELNCLVTSKYIGPMNASMYVSNRGASIIHHSGLYVDSQDRLFQYHTYPGVSECSLATGSSGGGSLMTFEGIGFDPTPGATEVFIGGAPCDVVDVTDDYVTCLVPPEADTGLAPCDRGLYLEVWDGIIINDLWDEAAWDSLTSSNGTSYYAGAQIEDLFDITVDEPVAIAKVSGFFHPPHDGDYKLGFATGWFHSVYYSVNGISDDKVSGHGWQRLSLSAGTPLYLEIRLRGYANTTFKVLMDDINTIYNNYQTPRAINEEQRIILTPSVIWEAQRLTSGNANLAKLTLNGRSSYQINVSDPDAVRDALLDLTEPQCEVQGVNPKFALDYDFEDGEEDPIRIIGDRINHIEPHCGRNSFSLDPANQRMYQENDEAEMPDVEKYPYLCYALRGDVESTAVVNFRFTDTNKRKRSVDIKYTHNHDSASSNTWTYKCIDLFSVANNNDWLAPRRNNNTKLLLHKVYAPKSSVNLARVYIDSFAVCSENIAMTVTPSALKSNNILVSDVLVEYVNENTTDMNITFQTSNCAGGFPLLGSNHGSVSVERLETATGPVSGTWSLDFLGTTVTDIPPDVDEMVLEAMLEELSGAGDMKVTRSGSCDQYKWIIQWKTNPGPKELVTADSALEFDGESVTLETDKKTEAKYWHNPVATDFFSAMRKEPCVSVKVNGYRAALFTDCAFKYDDTGAPTVSSVAGSTAVDGVVTFTIMGSDFSSANADDYKIMVGDHMCTGITVISTTELTCTVDYLAAGTYSIYLSMQPIGASLPHSVTYTVGLSIIAVDPTTGGIGGGFEFVTSGTGFPVNLAGWAGNSVSLGGVDCLVISADMSSVTCMAPPHAAGVVNVSVTVSGEMTVSVDAFTYDADLSGSLTSVSPTTSSVLGGETLTISGTDLGDGTDGSVMVGGLPCEVDTWTSTSITCSLPSNSPGDHAVTVYTGAAGYSSGSAWVTYILMVTAASPSVGSIMGGTLMSLEGEGFGMDCSLLSIDLGEGMECEVISCNDTHIDCITKIVPQSHVIDNLGCHPSFGKGWAWKPKHLVVREGDPVTWKWNRAKQDSTLMYNVFQTPSATDQDYGTSGFHSGSQTLAGSMMVTFSNAGTFFYAGDPVGSSGVVMSGRIDVKKPDEVAHKIMLFLNGIEADVNDIASRNSVNRNVEPCTFLETPVDEECNSTAPVAPMDGDLYFTRDKCYTPLVTAVTSSSTEAVPGLSGMQVKAGVMLTITGEGFGNEVCQSSVSVGDASCTVSSSTTDTITCDLDDLDNMVSLKVQPVVVTVANRGTASVRVADFSSEGEINIVPVVNDFTPKTGSVAGGTVITITGTGLEAFDSQATVQLGSGVCYVNSVTPTEIKCTTAATSASVVTLAVTISVFNIPAINEMGSSTYEFSDAVTPTVSSVSISVMTVSVMGMNFGNEPSAVTVTLAHTSLRSEKVEAAHHQQKERAESKPLEKEMKYEYFTAEYDELKKAYNEDGEEILSPEFIRLRSGMLDHIDVSATDFWARFTKTSARSLDESLRLEGVWRMAGSNLRNEVETTNEEEGEPLRTGARVASSYDCVPSSVADTQIDCIVTNLPAGEYDVSVTIEGVGDASAGEGDAMVTAVPEVSSIAPTSGSTNGGTLLTISGSGFTPGEITVTVGGATCFLVSESEMTVECLTAAYGPDTVGIDLTSGGATSAGVGTFTYDSAMTPMISSVVPNTGLESNMELTLTGTGFNLSGSNPEVTIGGETCNITIVTSTSVTCKSPDMMSGTYSLMLIDDVYGNSNQISVDYDFAISNVMPDEGGFGGAVVVVSGKGFSPYGGTTVTICGEECVNINASSTSIACELPPLESGRDQDSVGCDVVVTNPSRMARSGGTYSSGFTFVSSLTPTVTATSPKRGGTAGGTTLTITGTNFGASGNTVTIGGSPCLINSESTTSIECVTEAHAGPGQFAVKVTVPDGSIADVDENGLFFYIDRFSSVFTWGGEDPPSTGQLVGVTAGQTLLIDVSTDVLGMLLIDGGHVMIDPEATDEIILRAEYILIVGGGKLSVGTEEEPYPGNAVIEMHGNTRSLELPVYGAKVLAVRHGDLDLHGQYVPVTWTHLAATASAGATTISLKQPVTWKAGDEIIIATTEQKMINNESEQRTIASVSGDGRTLTLTEALDYEHISIEQTLGGKTVETRAEVGLLTRNVKVRGNINQAFLENIEPCDTSTWRPGQFDVQSCFNGRFGEEIGSDQFGSAIIIGGKDKLYGTVTARIGYVEVTFAGQAFRLGRYPIHFHIVGNVNSSYVRGCAIHWTFNRAVTIHAADYLLVEKNVAYNNMGHAFFTEDGIEENNIIQYNLAVFTRTSSSLLNVDITPSSFWVVNPNNIVRHNAAAGGTHFGYWYRLEAHPSGPSYTTSFCPNHRPLGEFFNNTAHSEGRYGLWLFSMDGYFPKDDGCSGNDLVAVWRDFIAWRCERGAEFVIGGNLQTFNFITLDNEKAGVEMVEMHSTSLTIDSMPGVFDSMVVGHSALTPDDCTGDGIVAAKKYIFAVSNTKFVNFDTGSCAALSGCSECKELQGGFRSYVQGLSYENAENQKLRFKWEHETIWMDTDGSLSGTSGPAVVVPDSGLLSTDCVKSVPELSLNTNAPGSVCTNVKFLRFDVNGLKVEPESLQYRDLNISNQHGFSLIPYRNKRLTHTGWMGILQTKESYTYEFVDAEQLTNISYDSDIRFVEDGDYFYVTHEFFQTPDAFGTTGDARNSSDALPDPVTGYHGDYYWNNNTNEMTYLVSSNEMPTVRENAGPGELRIINFRVYRCFFEDCIAPTPPPVPTGRPDQTFRWSDVESWKEVPVGSGGHPTEDEYHLPNEGDHIIIPGGMWMIVDVPTLKLGRVYVYGALEFEDVRDYEFEATIIYMQGGTVVAGFSEDAPFTNNLKITLRGSLDPDDPDNEDMPMPIGTPNVGWKAIGAFGPLKLHGEVSGSTWLKLGATANAGDTELTLAETPDPSWQNKEVMVTSTGKDPKETEIRTITAISGSTITLDEALDYEHLGETYTLSDGTEIVMAGEVGLLTRNIVIEGNDYGTLAEDGLGGRVLVSKMSDGGIDYNGQAQLMGVEFRNMGQEGFTDTDDPRYSLAFSGMGTNDGSNYVKKCSFNKNFNAAIGLFGSNNITFEDNVVYFTVGSAIEDESSDNVYLGNLVVLSQFTGTYNGRNETQNIKWEAAFMLALATGYVLDGNTVGGAEQIGFRTDGEMCDDASLWMNNEVHSAIFGVMLWRRGAAGPPEECRRLRGFYAWRVWDTGFYMQHYSSLLLTDVKAVDCKMGVNLLVYSPHALSHTYYDKTATVEDSLFVGATPAHTCEYQASTSAIVGPFFSGVLWSPGPGIGNTAITLACFTSTINMAPKHPFAPADSYPAIRGGTYIKNVTFAKYADRSCGRNDFAILTNKKGDDGIHPVFTSELTFLETPEDNYMFLFPPNLGTVNPSDCVDMDCDGHKKVIVTDMDGSLLGQADATATSQAEFEWDGDPHRGVGDYRIPVALKQNLDGSEINAADKFPNKGIVRDGSCSLMTSWRAWKCTALKHRMMIIESMDSDTEIRRLSPIALIADPGTNGYVDLLNGPMDRGWCMGYTCQERISTFYSVVATNYMYEVALTSTPPQQLRFHLLHADSSEPILLRIYFPKTQRYDVYVDGVFKPPTNIDSSSVSYQLKPVDPSDPEEFFPTLSDDVGTNFLQRTEKFLHVVLRGGSVIDIKQTPTVILSTGVAMSPDEIFEGDVIGNMAAFLGIAPENIRLLDVIREDSKRSGLMRQETNSSIITMEIASAPPTEIDGDTSDIGPVLTFTGLQEAMSTGVNNFQSQNCSSCNIPIETFSLIAPDPPPPVPEGHASEEEGAVVIDEGDLYSNVQQKQELEELEASLTPDVYDQPGGSTLDQDVPSEVKAFEPFAIQPMMSVQSNDGEIIDALGTDFDPWIIEASLYGPSNADLLGITEVPYSNGSATFTDLSINNAGSGYYLTFSIVYPPSAPRLTLVGSVFNVAPKMVSLAITSVPKFVTVKKPFSIEVTLKDEDTSRAMDPSQLKGQVMKGKVRLKRGGKKRGKVIGNVRIYETDGRMSVFMQEGLEMTKKGSNRRLKISARVPGPNWNVRAVSERILVLPEGLEIPDDAVTKKVKMVGRFGRVQAIKDDLQQFAIKVMFQVRQKVGRAAWTEPLGFSNGKKPVAKISVTGSESQITDAIDTLCDKIRQRKITIRVKAHKFIMSGLKVDGKKMHRCKI